MNEARHRVEKVQNTEELANGGFHTLECHSTARDVLQQLDCVDPKRFVDQNKVAAVRAIHMKMTEQFANEFPARMVRVQSVYVVIDLQFMVP